MSIDRLRYFATVVETKSLRKAADLVGISAPSMSKAISILEEEIGHKLIYAEGRGIGITAAGMEVYRSSTPLLEEYRRFYDHLNRAGQKGNQLRIATFEVFSTYFTSAFLKSQPDLDVLMLEKTPGSIEDSVLSGTVDVGLTYLPVPNPALEFLEIGSFKMGLYGHKKWEDKPFEEWPFAIPTTELKVHTSEIDALDMWPRGGPQRKVKYRFELLETALQTTRDGLSVIHCPSFIISLQNEMVKSSLQLVPLKTPPQYKPQKNVKVYLVHRKGFDVRSLEGKLAKFMRMNY